MLHSLIVHYAEQALKAFFTFEVDFSKSRISLNYFVKDIEVERKLVNGLNLLHQLTANRATDSKILVKLREALCAESVTTMH
jgi:hypothetical protein